MVFLFILLGLFLASCLFSNSLHEQNAQFMKLIDVVPDKVPQFSIEISSDRGEWGHYENGNRISFRVKASKKVWAVVVGVDVNGGISLLLPNPYDTDNQLQARKTVILPRTGYHYEVNTPGQGTEHVIIVGSEKRTDLLNSLVSRINAGTIANGQVLGNALRQMAEAANGDWAMDVTSYYCNSRIPTQTGMLVLSIGVGNYLSGDIDDLKSPPEDARSFAQLMEQKYYVPSSNIRVLIDSQATRSGILQGLEWLVSQADSGKDIVFFYSGHGGQLEDRNGDEADGLDEVICPYDFSMEDKFGTAIFDDEIAQYIQKLSTKARTVTFIFDSCFSGSAQKALPQGVSDSETGRKGMGVGTSESMAKSMDLSGISNFAFLAAAKGNETARDFYSNFGHSLYTYFFLKGLDGAADANGDGHIGTMEIHNYVFREIGVVSQSANQYFQTPILDPSVDFVIWK